MKDEFIKIDEWPPDYAQRAYDAGFLIEAIQVLHGWIECQARGLLMLVGSVHFSTDFADTWDAVDQMAYKDVVIALLAIGQFTKKDADDLLKINSTRNRMIHQVFKDPHEKQHDGFPCAEYNLVFKEALNWSQRILEKREALI